MKLNKNPLVSIIIPIYNGSNYMREAIDSALNQTYKQIEIIVVNDGSTDEGKTDKIAKSYGDKIRYFSKDNGGVSTALNLAIKNMKGEYFSWLSHDDVYYPNKISTQINYLKDHNLLNENIILYSDYELIDKNSKIIQEVKKDHSLLMKKPEYAILKGNINGLTLLIPKKAFEEYGFFDEKLRCVQDYEMWRLMLSSYKFIHIDAPLIKSREHGEQVTYNNPNVVSEGNALWKRIVDTPSEKMMIDLEGSPEKYYLMMTEFLYKKPYKEAFDYCKEKYLSLAKDRNHAIEELENKLKTMNIGKFNMSNFFKKIVISLKRYGFLITIKRIFKKI